MLLHIALKDLKILFRDRKALAVMLAMPLLIVLILGFALNGVFSNELAVQKFSIAVVNKDEGLMSQIFINRVLRSEMSKMFATFVVDESNAGDMLKNKTVPVVITIPENFSKDIENRKPVKLEIKSNDEGQFKANIVRSVTDGFAQSISQSYAGAFAVVDVFKKYKIPIEKQMEGMSDASAMMAALQGRLGNGMLEFNGQEQEKNKSLSAMGYYAAAMLVMFLLFGANMGTRLIIEEREKMTLGRIMSARPGKVILITGKFLGLMIICLAQAFILMAFMRIFYRVAWGTSIAGILAVTLCSAFAAAAFGMFIAAIAKTPKAADGFGQMFIQVFTIVGGGMIPIYIMPEAMKTAAKFTLNWWAFSGYHNLMLGMDVFSVLPACGILLLMGVAYLSFGILKFRV